MGNRRDFLQQLAITMGAGAAVPALLRAGTAGDRTLAARTGTAQGATRADRIEALGVQLYTVRTLMQQDVERTLARVGEVGYREVEFAGYFGRTPAQVREALGAAGLVAPSTHIALAELLPANLPRVLDAAHVMGHQWLVLAWTNPAQRRNVDDWKRMADRMLSAAELAKPANVRVAYHNHDYEWTPLPGGVVPYDFLLEQTRGSTVAFEMDLCWITKAGHDPMAYWLKWPERFPMVHVKDAVFAPAFAMKDVGAGTMNWKGLFKEHVQAGIEHYFVEHDEPADPMASITASATYLRALTF